MVIAHDRGGYLSGRTRLRDRRHVIRAIVIGAVLALAALAVWHRPPDAAPAAVAQAATPVRHAVPKASPAAPAVVYVTGAVVRPGLYPVAGGARVADAVRLAGGLLADADPVAVNLAAHVRDGDEIAVSVRGAPVATAARSRKTAASRTRAVKTVPSEPIDVNSADAQTLATVPGVGAVIARRIIAVRENDGPYTSLDQLLDVAGMTLARLDRASPFLTI